MVDHLNVRYAADRRAGFYPKDNGWSSRRLSGSLGEQAAAAVVALNVSGTCGLWGSELEQGAGAGGAGKVQVVAGTGCSSRQVGW